MKHISHYLPTVAEVAQMRERALLQEEVKRRRFLTDMIAIHFADRTFATAEQSYV
jgi:hypothetical protein